MELAVKSEPIDTRLELSESLAHDLHLAVVFGEFGLECAIMADLREHRVVPLPRA